MLYKKLKRRNEMRKIQKNIALEFIQTLYQAHEQIKHMINRKKINHAMNLLEQCQQGAIQLGDLIEKTVEKNVITIDLLENYCETLYNIHENIMTNEIENANKVCKILRKQLLLVENSIINDIKQTIEVVFLPYNATMWDSLESVWRAAEADENCDAYVIPIPYYDKNPDGSFKKEHWDVDKYPDYVSITRYIAYDFEKRRPDIIFIHNPYDECNHVTSVHPFFYSENLKKFTDKLVYIPYFMLDEINFDNEMAVEHMKHFCTAPGILRADNVIVQSEDMRKIYINVLTENTGNTKEVKQYWEDRVLGLGSPKVDKVLNTRKEDLSIPDKWKKIVQKADGSRKKIILYNTSIGALLENDEQMLRKMKWVFTTFEKNKDEVALLWRPHPLLESTIFSIRPQLWKLYIDIRDNYINAGWGIYDDTVDIDRAVIMSDGYYGDYSSVMQLCIKVGIPIMIQNII